MIFRETPISGATFVEPDPRSYERGMFARTYCEREYPAAGLPSRIVQANISRSLTRGTVRGMHMKWPPSPEGTLVRCSAGRILDVAIDLRPDSPIFMRHVAAELDARSGRALYVAAGLAHGFQTLEDDCEISYLTSDFCAPALQAGVRRNDRAFGIAWPIKDVKLGAVVSGC